MVQPVKPEMGARIPGPEPAFGHVHQAAADDNRLRGFGQNADAKDLIGVEERFTTMLDVIRPIFKA